MSWPSIRTMATPAPLVVLLNPIASPLSGCRRAGREHGGGGGSRQLLPLGILRAAGHSRGRAQRDRARQQAAPQSAGRPDREVPRRPIGKYENVGAAAKPRGAFGDGLGDRKSARLE